MSVSAVPTSPAHPKSPHCCALRETEVPRGAKTCPASHITDARSATPPDVSHRSETPEAPMSSNAPCSFLPLPRISLLLFQTRGLCQHHHPIQFLGRPRAFCRETSLELACEMIRGSPTSLESWLGPSLLAASPPWVNITCHFQQANRLNGCHTVPIGCLSPLVLSCFKDCKGPGPTREALQTQEPGFDFVLLFYVVHLKGAGGFAGL